MLVRINTSYFITAILFIVFVLLAIEIEVIPLVILNTYHVITFFVIIEYLRKRKHSFFNESNLLITVGVYSVCSVIIFNLISYLYQGNFFVFSESDAVKYHMFGIEMSNMPINQAIEYFLTIYQFDDLGYVLVLRFLYKFISSNLIVNGLNIVLGILTAKFMFKISSHLMITKYAFFAALTFSIASFTLWFQASGLKETIMVFLVVSFFYGYSLFAFEKRIAGTWVIFLALIGLLFFRPVIGFFCLVSLGLSYMIGRWKSVTGLVLITVMILSLLVLFPMIIENFNRYTKSGDLVRLLYAQESKGIVQGGFAFTYFINALAQAFGPFPTFQPTIGNVLSFYSPGLVYRVLISIPFWFGIVYLIKNKYYKIFPFILFIFMEMFSLFIIVEGLEFRKSFPHIPIVFIVAFTYLSAYDTHEINRFRKYIYPLTSLSILLLFLFLIAWNIRLFI